MVIFSCHVAACIYHINLISIDMSMSWLKLVSTDSGSQNIWSNCIFILDAEGQTSVTFGVLFNDDQCANLFEALVGTLRAAKRKKIISFEGELLLQGVHDNVDIVLLKEWGCCEQTASKHLWASLESFQVLSFCSVLARHWASVSVYLPSWEGSVFDLQCNDRTHAAANLLSLQFDFAVANKVTQSIFFCFFRG